MVIVVAFLWFFQAKAAAKPTSKAAAKPSSKASAKPVSASAKPTSRAGSKKPASKVSDLLFILVATTHIMISSHALVIG